jgi:hypothetical protein
VGLDRRGAICARSGLAAKWKHDSPTYRPVSSAWRPASAHTI